MIPKLDVRLSSAAAFVRDGAAVADVGTDHAYLPIYLLLSGKCPAAVASDVNEGPLMRAKADAEKYGVADKITFCLADGLCGLPLEEENITDIVICGMGGELIASIIGASEYAKRGGVRLILQPMTKIAELREWLDRNSFATVDETVMSASGRLYQCLAVEYTGERDYSTPAELALGKINIARGRGNHLFVELVAAEIESVTKKIDGLKKGGQPADAEIAFKAELEAIAERIEI